MALLFQLFHVKKARFLVVSQGHIVSSKLHVEEEDFDGYIESRRRTLWTLCVFNEYIRTNNPEHTCTVSSILKMDYLLVMLAVVVVPVLGLNHDLVTQTNCSAFPRAFNQLSKRVDQLQVTINKYLTQERACARASVAKGLSSSLIINKATSFTVLVRDCGGYDLTTGGDNVTATLTCVDYPSLVSPQPTVVDNGDGSYQVSLSPECSGNNLVSITINGKTIKDMPVTVAVIPPYTSLRLKHTITNAVQGPYAITFSENGEVFIGGYIDNNIHHFHKNGTKLNSWRAPKSQIHSIVIVDNFLYMSQCDPPKVYKYTLTGVLLGPVLVDGCYIHLLIGPDGRNDSYD